jgi:hypothetical protein
MRTFSYERADSIEAAIARRRPFRPRHDILQAAPICST